MGDFKPEIVYENAQISEIDPRDDSAISLLNESGEDRFVTVKDGIGLPVIAAFRLLASKLDAKIAYVLRQESLVAQSLGLSAEPPLQRVGRFPAAGHPPAEPHGRHRRARDPGHPRRNARHGYRVRARWGPACRA